MIKILKNTKIKNSNIVAEIADKRKEHWEKNKNNDIAIEVKDLIVDFGETLALKKISLEMKRGELITLVGPSGCGKTTLLNTISGLLTPSSGKIIFNNKNVTKSSPKERKLGFVFQNYALYPHMSVYKNISFPLINDKNWKDGVRKKNHLNLLKIDQIKLLRAKASHKEIDKMFNLFFNIFDAKKEAISYYETLVERLNGDVSLAKINIESSKISKNQRMKELSEKQLLILETKLEKFKIAKENSSLTKEQKQKYKDNYKILLLKSQADFKKAKDIIDDNYKKEIIATKAKYSISKAKRKENIELQAKASIAKNNKKTIESIGRKIFKAYRNELLEKYDIKNIELTDIDKKNINQFNNKIMKIKEVIHNEVMRVSEVVGITKNLSKKPTKLSGGQQQRVAIARAIVKNPDILLMDEPLSNLDAKLRITTREWIRGVQKQLGITTIFVTHDQEEAMAISDTVVCMSDGEIQQIGKPLEIYNNPKNEFVAKFIGMPEMKIIKAKVNETKDIIIDGKKIGKAPFSSREIKVGARAEFLKETTKTKGFEVAIKNITKLGREKLATVNSKTLGDMKVFLDIDKKYQEDQILYLNIDSKKISFFNNKGDVI